MSSLSFKQQKELGMLFIVMSCESLILALGIGLPYTLILLLYLAVTCLVFIHIFKERLFAKEIHLLYLIYLLYIFFQIIHGFFNAETYWHYRFSLVNTFSLLIPIFALLFSNPSTSIGLLQSWKNVIDPKYLIVFLTFLVVSRIHLMYGPAYFLFGIFIFWLSRKWQIIIGVLLILMIFGSFGARSQVIKGLLTIFFAAAIYYHRYIPIFLVHLGHWFFYLVSILFVILGVSGVYNVFSPDSFEGEKTIETNQVYGQSIEEGEDLSADTRTFIYVEVITSAIENDYVIFGRSPSRGNDTKVFAAVSEDLFGSNERFKNELCHLNVFTWTGIVGVILYTLLYLQASYLALYRSRNVYLKYLSVLVAFHWAYGWIENCNDFNMMNVGLWLIIGICLSPQFRFMTEKEFELWFKSIFSHELFTPYHQMQLNKELNLLKNKLVI